LRAGDEGLAQLQPARRAPRDLRHRAPAHHPARAQAVAGRGRGLPGTAREARVPGVEEGRGSGVNPLLPPLKGRTSTQEGPPPRGGGLQGKRLSMSDTTSLLIELGTEELPVKALPGLAQALFDGVVDALGRRGIAVERLDAKPLYTPRRLAVLLPSVAVEQPEQASEVPGPYLNIALDADGQPTRALQGFAAKAGVEWTALERSNDSKGERFVHRSVKPG